MEGEARSTKVVQVDSGTAAVEERAVEVVWVAARRIKSALLLLGIGRQGGSGWRRHGHARGSRCRCVFGAPRRGRSPHIFGSGGAARRRFRRRRGRRRHLFFRRVRELKKWFFSRIHFFQAFSCSLPRCALPLRVYRAPSNQRMYILRTSARRKITETMRSLSLLCASQSQAAAATASTTTPSVRMLAPLLPGAAFRTLDFHLSRSTTMSRRHMRGFLSHFTVSAAAAADAEAVSSTASAAADFVGALEEEEQLPTSFKEFELDERVTVCSSLEKMEGKRVRGRGAFESTSILVFRRQAISSSLTSSRPPI